ncbi:MAG: 50S ribosomal protein L23 [Candidatus Hadarchaeales archaeon]
MKDPHRVILYPLATEKVVKMIESENAIAFVVSEDSNKNDIKQAVEVLFNVKVKNVRVEVMPDGKKRAYVRLAPGYMADEIAAKLGLV